MPVTVKHAIEQTDSTSRLLLAIIIVFVLAIVAVTSAAIATSICEHKNSATSSE